MESSFPSYPNMRCTLPLLLLSAPALAQTPHVDTGFTPGTPLPDADLVVVRELAYGASGVDLTTYGIGTAPVDYVQSIYVRYFRGSGSGAAAFKCRLEFPAGVQVLGVVSNGSDLGGSPDDGMLTELDALFAIPGVPADDYSAPDRGLENSPNEIGCAYSDTGVVLSFSTTTGVDDVRILIDYGSSFPADASFDLQFLDPDVPAHEELFLGLQVGDTTGTVPGALDYGEAEGVQGIPLVGGGAGTTTGGFDFDPANSLFLIRSQGSARLDVVDLGLGFTIPGLQSETTGVNPIDLDFGPKGLLWTVGTQDGTASFETRGYATSSAVLNEDLPGALGGLTVRSGEDDFLYVARNNNAGAGETFVDEVRLCDMEIVRSLAIPGADLAVPKGITEGGDGNLWVLGNTGELVRLDPVTGASVLMADFTGSAFADLAPSADGMTLILVRDAGASSSFSTYDIGSGTSADAVATLPERLPRRICSGPGDLLFLVGGGGNGEPETLWGLDPATWTVQHQIPCIDAGGTVRGLAYVPDLPASTNFCGPAEPQASGRRAIIRAKSNAVAGDPLELSAYGLPANQFGYFLAGQGSGIIFPVGGSDGRLCLGGAPIGRYVTQVQTSGSGGRFCTSVSTSMIPVTPAVAAMPGDTWNFQAWFRDGQSSNFTDAVAVSF